MHEVLAAFGRVRRERASGRSLWQALAGGERRGKEDGGDRRSAKAIPRYVICNISFSSADCRSRRLPRLTAYGRSPAFRVKGGLTQ